MRPFQDEERSSYLGYPLLVTARNVHVYAPASGGRRLASVPSVKQARLFVKGFRAEGRRAA